MNLKIRVAASASPYNFVIELIRNPCNAGSRNSVSAPIITDRKIADNILGTFFNVLKNLVHIFYPKIESEFSIHTGKPEFGICISVAVAFFFIIPYLRPLIPILKIITVVSLEQFLMNQLNS